MKLLGFAFLFCFLSVTGHAQLTISKIDSLIKVIDNTDSLNTILSCGYTESNPKNLLRKIFIGKKRRGFSETTYYDKKANVVFKAQSEEPYSTKYYYFYKNSLIFYSQDKSFIRGRKAGKFYFDNDKLIYATTKQNANFKVEMLPSIGKSIVESVTAFNNQFHKQ